MIRALFFIALLVLLSVAAVWIAERPGTVDIRWQDYRVESSVAVLALAAAAAAVALAGFYILLRWLWVGPRRLATARAAGRRRRGYRALTRRPKCSKWRAGGSAKRPF